jgi:hypothetical protein
MTCLTVSAGERRAPISMVCGIAHRPFDERLNLHGNGGGEKRGVALARAFVHDAAHVGEKAHVEHAVGFVEHEVLDVIELAGAAFDVVEQTTGSGDDDVEAGAEGIHLAAITDATVKNRGAEIGKASEITDGGLDLGGEFAGRFED